MGVSPDISSRGRRSKKTRRSQVAEKTHSPKKSLKPALFLKDSHLTPDPGDLLLDHEVEILQAGGLVVVLEDDHALQDGPEGRGGLPGPAGDDHQPVGRPLHGDVCRRSVEDLSKVCRKSVEGLSKV